MQAPLDPQALDRLIEAEARGNHANAADDRRFVGVDLVAGERQPVAARRRHVLGEGEHANPGFRRQRADAPENQRRLHRRAARRVDRERHRLDAVEVEGALERALDRGERQPAAQRPDPADDAAEAHHADHRRQASQRPERQLRQEASDLHAMNMGTRRPTAKQSITGSAERRRGAPRPRPGYSRRLGAARAPGPA